MGKEKLNYTLILHRVRQKLELSLMEYCIADSIYHLSNNPKNKITGWCYASKKNLAEFLGTSSATIFSNINRLIKKGLVEKDKETKYLQTTQKWYDNVVMFRLKTEYQETLHPIKKLDTSIKKLDKEVSRNFIPGYKETLHNNNTNKDNNNNKDNNTAKQSFAGLSSKELEHKKEIDDLIDLFKEVNPTHDRLFGNKTERASLERLVIKFGKDWLEKLIKALPEIVKQPYAPRISSPYQLEIKMGELKIFIEQQRSIKDSKVKEIIYAIPDNIE